MAIETVEIEQGPFTLRPPTATDIPWIFDACQDPLIQRYTTVPSPYRADDAVGWVRQAATLREEGVELHLLVALTESGELLGAASIRPTPDRARAEIGYWVERYARGRGAASGAVLGLEAWASASLGATETFLRIAEENDASRRVALRCGYRLEGPDPEPFRGLPVLRFSKRLDARSAGE